VISKFDVTIQSDELTAADLYNAQAEWEAEQYEVEMAEIAQAQWEAFQADHEAEYEWTEEAIEWEEGMHPDNLYDDDPYSGEMWEDTYEDPADMYEWDCDLYNEF